MNLNKSILLATVILGFSVYSFAQDLKIGAALRSDVGLKNERFLYGLAVPLQFNLSDMMLSINAEPSILFGDEKANPVYTLPFFLKLSIGKTFKISPLGGIYWRTNSNSGLLFGLDFSCALPNKIELYLKSDLLFEYYPITSYNHSGSYEDYNIRRLLGFSLGFRYNLLGK